MATEKHPRRSKNSKFGDVFGDPFGEQNKTAQRLSLWAVNIWWALEDLNF